MIRELEGLLPTRAGPRIRRSISTRRFRTHAPRWQQAPELPRGLQQDLAARYYQTLGRLVAAWPSAFTGTDLDPDTTRKRMEKLVTRVEELVPEFRDRRRSSRRPNCSRAGASASPPTR